MEIKDGTGEQVFELITIGPCETCVLAGKGGECPHYEKPPWKSGRKYQQAQAVLAASGDDGLGAREMDGIITSSKHYLIAQKFILDFVERSKLSAFVFTIPVPVILIGLDPHGGGDGSASAIIDVVLTRDKTGERDVVRLFSSQSHTRTLCHNLKYSDLISHTKSVVWCTHFSLVRCT